jgi:5'-nucleotidase
VMQVLRPHIFVEDQMRHLISSAASAPSVHVPFGAINVTGEAL